MEKLSVLIATRNDIDNAMDLIKYVYGVADDIVILDSSSRVERRRFQKELRHMKKCRMFYVLPFGYPDPYRMYGLKMCKNNWVLLIDVDERLTAKFREDLATIISSTPADALAIKRYEEAEGPEIGDFYTWQTRLFKKTKVLFRGLLHEQPIVYGKLERLVDDEYYLRHEKELRTKTSDEYAKMMQFDRYSYSDYNNIILDYMRKMDAIDNNKTSTSPTYKLVKALLRIYEAIALKNMDNEISMFDYRMLFLMRDVGYAMQRGSEKPTISHLLASSEYQAERVRKWRSTPDSKEIFEISKRINRIGMTKFLEIDSARKVDALNKKYKDKKEGADFLIWLLKKTYEERQSKA